MVHVGPLKRTTADFEGALENARAGSSVSETLMPDEVDEALREVAIDASDASIAGAWSVWWRTSDLGRLLPDVDAVVFDVGETLVDETRAWAEAAAAVGTTPFTLMGVLGSLIERDADHREVWEVLGVDPPPPTAITAADLYPDAIDCLRAVRASGRAVGIAGNQPGGVEDQLRTAGVEVDFVASSTTWGVAKPSRAFFERIVAAAGLPSERIAYVGDRLDNDVLPARSAGLRTVFLRRGPWGHVHAQRPEVDEADAVVDSLAELTGFLRDLATR